MFLFYIYDKLEDTMSIFSSYKKIFLLGFTLVILIAIPFSVYIAQKRQNISSKAAQSTTLSFEPATATAKTGDTVTLGIMLDPGTGPSANQVSFAKFTINFDASKFATVAGSLTPNTSGNALTVAVDDAAYAPGKISISLSIGADPTKAIVTKTKIAILQLKATDTTAPTTPNITFDSSSTNAPQVLSISSSDQLSENVLSSAIPATVTVTGSTSSSTTAANAPTCTSFSADRVTIGTPPYPITFTAKGGSSNGTINKISFYFGDGPAQDLTTGSGIGTNSISAQMSHSYNALGTFTAYAILTDNSGNTSTQQASCSQTVTMNQKSLGSGGVIISQPQPPTSSDSGSLSPIITITPTVTAIPTQTILPPTGPGAKMLNIGMVGAVFTIIGGALLIFL